MLRISVAVMVRCPRDTFCFISHCEWNAACHSGSTRRRAKQRCKWGTLDHLRFSTRAGFRVWSEPKRLLTHILCHRWHFVSLSCLHATPRVPVCVRVCVCRCLTCKHHTITWVELCQFLFTAFYFIFLLTELQCLFLTKNH